MSQTKYDRPWVIATTFSERKNHHGPAVAASWSAPAEGSPARPLCLKATAGVDSGKEWHAERTVVFIGRRNADIVLGDQEASRQHCVLELHGDRWMLKDLGSTNGTYLDDAKVNEAELRDGSRIRIGDTVLVAALPPARG